MSPRTTLFLLLAMALALAACSARRGEPIVGPLSNLSPQLVRGEVAFDRHCSRCHPGGDHGLGPAINNKPLPAFLIRFQVRHGLGAMPAISAQELPREDLDAVVAYLQTLRRHR
jgi:mono/diheme cytochrome c family protein